MRAFMELTAPIQQLPELNEDSIHIWSVHVPELRDRLGELASVLSDQERKKAERFRGDAERESSIAARGALRILLSNYTGVAAADIAFAYSETGKPHVVNSEVDFNISHSNEWVVLAFGKNRDIGVDIEKVRMEMNVESIAARFFAPEEVALLKAANNKHALFFQIWARKEAYIKACGSGLFRGLSRFSIPIKEGRLPNEGQQDGWHFCRLEACTEYAAAIVTDKILVSRSCYDFGGLKWDS